MQAGTYSGGRIVYGRAVGPMSVETEWLDQYDRYGNQYFRSYYPNSRIKLCEGYGNWKTKMVVSVRAYDRNGYDRSG